jgi:hypothetical protein
MMSETWTFIQEMRTFHERLPCQSIFFSFQLQDLPGRAPSGNICHWKQHESFCLCHFEFRDPMENIVASSHPAVFAASEQATWWIISNETAKAKTFEGNLQAGRGSMGAAFGLAGRAPEVPGRWTFPSISRIPQEPI